MWALSSTEHASLRASCSGYSKCSTTLLRLLLQHDLSHCTNLITTPHFHLLNICHVLIVKLHGRRVGWQQTVPLALTLDVLIIFAFLYNRQWWCDLKDWNKTWANVTWASHLSLLVPTSPCPELSCTAAATASIHRSCDPATCATSNTTWGSRQNTPNKQQQKKNRIIHCDALKVPSLRWLPSVIQLPFSSSALPHLVAEKKGNITHTTVVQVVALTP